VVVGSAVILGGGCGVQLLCFGAFGGVNPMVPQSAYLYASANWALGVQGGPGSFGWQITVQNVSNPVKALNLPIPEIVTFTSG
jgi:hypothetical protein